MLKYCYKVQLNCMTLPIHIVVSTKTLSRMLDSTIRKYFTNFVQTLSSKDLEYFRIILQRPSWSNFKSWFYILFSCTIIVIKIVQKYKPFTKFENQYNLMTSQILFIFASNSSSGYEDELAWAAAWLYVATGNPIYLADAEAHYHSFGLSSPAWAFSWDDKKAGVQVRWVNDIIRSLLVQLCFTFF